MLLVKCIKSILFATFALVVLFWTLQAYDKLKNSNVSSLVNYQYGDDNKGNLEIFTVSICPLQFGYRMMSESSNSNEKVQNFVQFVQKKWKLFQTWDELIGVVQWNISKSVTSVTISDEIEFKAGSKKYDYERLWQPTYDMHYGVCYSFNPQKNGVSLMPYKYGNDGIYMRIDLLLDVSIFMCEVFILLFFDFHYCMQTSKRYVNNCQ